MQDLFRQLAEEVREAVEAEPEASGWTEAVLDVRYANAGTNSGKLRATVAGKPVSVSTLHGSLTTLRHEIWEARAGEPFYGFVLSVSPRGEVEISLNYDANCFSDPDFWAS